MLGDLKTIILFPGWLMVMEKKEEKERAEEYVGGRGIAIKRCAALGDGLKDMEHNVLQHLHSTTVVFVFLFLVIVGFTHSRCRKMPPKQSHHFCCNVHCLGSFIYVTQEQPIIRNTHERPQSHGRDSHCRFQGKYRNLFMEQPGGQPEHGQCAHSMDHHQPPIENKKLLLRRLLHWNS